jgi:NADPH:quinone reductase-like Zn-dependent oxidoreductase
VWLKSQVVSTASPKNFDLVKSYGADEVVDVRMLLFSGTSS